MNQADVDRKRKIAQALMGMQAPQAQMVGRFYVPPSPGAQIASGIGNVAGSFIDRKADTGQQQLDDQKKAELAKRLQELAGGSGDPRMASALAAIQGMPIEQQEAAVAQLASRNLTPQGPIKLGANDRLIDPNTMQTTVDAQPKPGKLVAVIGPDGKPTYVPEEQAAGMTPFRSGGVTVNTGGKYGTIPPGYRLLEDESGARMEAIPGGPAERDIQMADEKAAGRREDDERQGNLMLQEIDRINARMDTPSLPETGVGGMFLKNIPGTDAFAVNNHLQTLKANIGFDELNQMRQNSPTGGALGNVTVKEIERLEAIRGNLEQAQDEADFRYNLARLNNTILDTIHGPNAGPPRMPLPEIGQPDESIQTADGTPQPGAVVDGYQFIGGDPADPNSWRQMQ